MISIEMSQRTETHGEFIRFSVVLNGMVNCLWCSILQVLSCVYIYVYIYITNRIIAYVMTLHVYAVCGEQAPYFTLSSVELCDGTVYNIDFG